MSGLPSSAVVRRLRVPAAAPARARRQVAAARLEPRGVPPWSLLVVRRLAARVRADGNAFARDVDDRLAAAVRAAWRPARGPAPTDCAAVLFADRGELLACLARDWLGGRLDRWWWRALAVAPGAAGVAERWRAEPAAVPDALARLAADGQAVAFAAALPVAAARALVAELARTHGLRAVGEALGGDVREPAEATATIVMEAAAAALHGAQRCLLGVGLTLARFPALARRPTFSGVVARWLAGAMADAAAPEGGDPAPASARGQPSPAAPSATTTTAASAGPPPGDAGVPPAPAAGDQQPPAIDAPTSDHAAARSLKPEAGSRKPEAGSSEPAAVVPQPTSNDQQPAASFQQPAPGFQPPSAPPSPLATHRRPAAAGRGEHQLACASRGDQATATPGAQRAVERVFTTRYGAALYLLNELLALEIYGDLGSTVVDCGLDLHAALAVLIHDLVVQPAATHCPATWTSPLPTAPPGGAATSTSPSHAGSLPGTASANVHNDPLWSWLCTQAGAAADAAPADLLAGFVPPPPPAVAALGAVDAQDWRRRLAATVDARLRRAVPDRAPADWLSAQSARVVLTAGRLDATFELDRLPVAVRAALLDRDPGFIPALGRWVRFHYAGGAGS